MNSHWAGQHSVSWSFITWRVATAYEYLSGSECRASSSSSSSVGCSLQGAPQQIICFQLFLFFITSTSLLWGLPPLLLCSVNSISNILRLHQYMPICMFILTLTCVFFVGQRDLSQIWHEISNFLCASQRCCWATGRGIRAEIIVQPLVMLW